LLLLATVLLATVLLLLALLMLLPTVAMLMSRLC
jgi:hypothetical protein